MSIKHRISTAVNSILTPFGVNLVRANLAFNMPLAVERIVEHDIPVKSIIDIGASDGKWSAKTMRTFPKASYLAIEPLQERQTALETLKQRHGNFDYVLCVAGDRDGEQVTLKVPDQLDSSTVGGTFGKPRSVPVKTVDALVTGRMLEGPFLLKFDTHGYEIPILAGAKDTLAKTNVIIMEVYNFKITDHALRFHEMCAHLERLGFRCFDIADPMLRPRDKAFWQMDLLFVKSDSTIFSYSEYK